MQEVIRELRVLCLHTNSETSSLSADPKIRVPTAFRTARQGIHDAIVSASYAGNVAKSKGLKTWMSCSPDYAYGRDNTSLFLEHLKRFHPGIEVVAEAWPELFQADYTENVTKILQAKPQALYSALWAGDLVSFIDQSSIYGLFAQTNPFAINMADYTTLTAVKNLPAGIHSATRYIKTFPPGRRTRPGPTPTKRSTATIRPTGRGKTRLPMSFLIHRDEEDQLDRFGQARRRAPRHEDQDSVRCGRHDHDARRGPDDHRLRARLGYDDSERALCAECDAG